MNDIYDKLVSEVTMKVTFTGSDLKLDIKEIKASTPLEVAGTAKVRTKKMPSPDKRQSVKLEPSDLPPRPANTKIVFLAFKLAPNQKLDMPVLLATGHFNPECGEKRVLPLNGDGMVVFWDTKDLEKISPYNKVPDDGLIWFFNPNKQEIAVDIYVAHAPPTPPQMPPAKDAQAAVK